MTRKVLQRSAPKNRTPYAVHAVNALLDWDRPAGVPADWTPTVADIIAEVQRRHGENVTETEARTALEAVLARQAAA